MCDPNVVSNLTSSEWAAWVQAIGSILAIIGATGLAIWQSNKQQKNSLELLSTEHRLARLEVAQALLCLSTNSLRLLKNYAKQFPDRSAIHDIGYRQKQLDTNELKVVEGAVQTIPLYSLPHQLVSLTMMLGSTIRQFREHVELVIKVHREMDSEQFNAFFTNISEMQNSL